MTIQEQKALADWVLGKLSPHYSILLAGGAPRDWYFDKPGNDLDFFIAGEDDHEFVMNELLIGLSPVATKEYENSPFIVYEGMVDEQAIQFIFQAETSAREIIKRFPCVMSWAWYDGECHYDRLFEIGANYKMAIWPEDIPWSESRYVDKMFARFPYGAGWEHVVTVKQALREIGKARTVLPGWTAGVNPAQEIPMPARENEPGMVWVDDPFAV